MIEVNDNESFLDHINNEKVENLNINFEIDLPTINIFYLDGLEFYNCKFNNKVNFKKSSKSVTIDAISNDLKFYFYDCKFQQIDFTDVVFTKKIRFHKCDFFSKIIFTNPTFKGLVDFWNSTFHKRVIFHKVNFNDVVVLSSAIFKENVLFTYSTINKILILRGATFEKGLDLSLAIILGDIIIFNLKLDNFESVKEPEKNVNWMESYDGITSIIGHIFNSNKRETFRILKNKLISQKNIIDSTNFSYLENKTLSEEICLELESPKNIKSFLLSFSNGFMLFLNLISNKHRTSYTRGIAFTLGFTFIFYYLSLIASSKYSFSLGIELKDNLYGYFNFLLPTHKFNYLGQDFLDKYVTENNNYWFYIWDTIGRIIVGYGIYQTIQAFRKYRG